MYSQLPISRNRKGPGKVSDLARCLIIRDSEDHEYKTCEGQYELWGYRIVELYNNQQHRIFVVI